jgi:hypothetical protein
VSTLVRQHASPPARRRGPTWALIGLVIASASIVGVLGGADVARAFPPSLIPAQGVYFGSRVGERGGESPREAIQRVEGQIGRKFDIDHEYYRWDQAIPTSQQRWDVSTGRLPFVNWSAADADGSVIPWSSIADGSQDWWIIRRADAFMAFGSPIYLAFHHEPEDDLSRFGSSWDYAAAFRHIVDVFRAQGVTNVAFVWNLMGWSFDSRSGIDVNAFYPGDDYVDFVGGDGYNKYPQAGSWNSFQQIFQPIYDFAVAHGKPLMVGEYGVMEDPSSPDHKGQWFRDALLTSQSWPQLKAMVYFDVYKDGKPWITDSSSSSMDGYRDLVNGIVTSPAPSSSPSPPPPVAQGILTNHLNMGPQGAPVVAGAGTGRDAAFSSVTASEGASLTYDWTHARGTFAVEHQLLPHSDSYYEWDGTRTIWFGRVYVWFVARPPSNLRLIRAASDGTLSCSIDVMSNGVLRFNDSLNQSIVDTRSKVKVGRWVRIEWRINNKRGTVVMKLFNRANARKPSDVVRAGPRLDIGASANQFQFGRSGHQPFTMAFWTDDPGLSSIRFLGAARR